MIHDEFVPQTSGRANAKAAGAQFPRYGYGSIPINTIFSGMNIHLPAILMFTRGTYGGHVAEMSLDICAHCQFFHRTSIGFSRIQLVLE